MYAFLKGIIISRDALQTENQKKILATIIKSTYKKEKK